MNPMYFDLHPADHNLTRYSTPKKVTRQISYKNHFNYIKITFSFILIALSFYIFCIPEKAIPFIL